MVGVKPHDLSRRFPALTEALLKCRRGLFALEQCLMGMTQQLSASKPVRRDEGHCSFAHALFGEKEREKASAHSLKR